MTPPITPVRIVYAKLTSTGSYDVVARTANVELDPARTLAERLLPGNIPHGVDVQEEIAYLRPPEGGHIVLRFAPYAWRDEHRGEVYLTDILWLNDADFARLRCNAFAAPPRLDAVYEQLTELPPVVVSERSEDADFARLAELAAAPGELARLVAGVLAANPALAIEPGERQRMLELFTLLLPPSLRPLLTFHARAFRVPAYLPRITLADALYANLQTGPWAAVLPADSLDVPQGRADDLVRAAREPAAFRQAHALYEALPAHSADLKEEVGRLLALQKLALALAGEDWSAALTQAVSGAPDEVAVKLGALLSAAPAEALRAAAASAAERAPAQALLLLQHRDADPEFRGALARGIVERLAAAGGPPDTTLWTPLLALLAELDDAESALALVRTAPRKVAATLPAGAFAGTSTGAFLGALRGAVGPSRGLGAAAELVRATAPLAVRLGDRKRLAYVFGELLRHSIEIVPAGASQLEALIALQAELDALLERVPELASALPALRTDRQLASDPAASESDVLHPDLTVLLAASLLLRAHRDADAGRQPLQLAAAEDLLQAGSPAMRASVRKLVADAGLGDEAVLALPAGPALLHLFGGSAEQTTLLREIVRSVAQLGVSSDAVGALALAVVRAGRAGVTLRAGARVFEDVVAALAAVPHTLEVDIELEAALDLLAMVVARDAFPQLEAAAVAGRRQLIRLRRLDRALLVLDAAEADDVYEAMADALEAGTAPLDADTRARLRRALGSGGLERRVLRAIENVLVRRPA